VEPDGVAGAANEQERTAMTRVAACRFVSLLAVPALLSLGFPAAASAQRVKGLRHRSATFFASLPFDPSQATSLAISPDATRGGFVRPKGQGFCAVIDGIEGPEYARVGRAGVVFSPDGHHTTYAAEKDGRWLVVRDGVEGQPFDAVRDETITFSGAAGRVAYVAQSGGKALVVDDGQAHPPHDRIADGSVVFSVDGVHLAYRAADGGREFVVYDGAAGAAYDSVGPLRFSPDGAHFAYAVSDGGDCFVVFDGRPAMRHKGAASIRPAAVTFTPDGRLVFVAADRDGERAVVGAAEGKPYPRVFEDSLAFGGPAGERVAHVAKRGRGVVVVVDGTEVGAHDGVVPGSLRFSRDGRRVAYLVERAAPGGGVARCVAADGREGKFYDWIGEPPVFSLDGRHVACVAERRRPEREGFESVLVVDGVESATAYPWIRGDLVFGVDGRRVAYMAAAPDNRFADAGLVPRVPGDAAAGARIVFHKSRGADLRIEKGQSPPPVKLLIVEEDVVAD
jgi:hypothetical protein